MEKVKNRKKTILHAVICVGLLCVIWGGYGLIKHYGTDRILEIQENDFSWVYQVDSVAEKDGTIMLDGFAFQLKRDSKADDVQIVLNEVGSEERVFLKTKNVIRQDVNEYFSCEYDYSMSGFEAHIPVKKVDTNKIYEILIRTVGERTTYETGLFYSDGRVTYVNPQEMVSLDVEGTYLEAVVEEGVLLFSRTDYGMYVYQYEGDLYWIAEDYYDFNDNGDTYIQFQLDTSQIRKLPESRLSNQWYWDNIGFMFSAGELLNEETGKYRVTRKALPTEYSITKIWTGNHKDGWIWKQDFRPFYELEK